MIGTQSALNKYCSVNREMMRVALMREVDGLGMLSFSGLEALLHYLSALIFFLTSFSSSDVGSLEEMTWEVRALGRWRGPWLSVDIEALPWVSSQPSSILKHMHSQQARLGGKAVVEAFPRQHYLP